MCKCLQDVFPDVVAEVIRCKGAACLSEIPATTSVSALEATRDLPLTAFLRITYLHCRLRRTRFRVS